MMSISISLFDVYITYVFQNIILISNYLRNVGTPCASTRFIHLNGYGRIALILVELHLEFL